MNNKTIHTKINPVSLYSICYPIKYLMFAVIILVTAYFIKPYVPEDILMYISIALTTVFLISYIISFLYIKSITYTVTDEQITFERGIFTTRKDYLELYRIIDFTEVRPFLLRIIGGMTFVMATTDKSHPEFVLEAIPKSNIDILIRDLVEENRKQKRVIVTE